MKNGKWPFVRWTLGVSLCTLVWCAPAYAQQVTPTQDDTQSDQPTEILVTARRQSESLLDVPMSVTVLTAQDIKNANIEEAGDFARLVPNVTFDTGLNLGQTHLTIRGISQVQGGELPAALVVDGVLLISPLQFNTENVDFAQIEVLKGPQGAIYGRNAIAGAINIVTTRPGDHLGGEALLGFASGEEYRARLSLDGPLVEDVLGFNASLSYTDRRGELRNITTGLYKDNSDNLSARLRLLVTPSPDLTFDLKYAYSDTNGGDPTYVANTTGDVNDTSTPITSDFIGSNPRQMHEISGTAQWETDIGTALVALAYVNIDERIASDFDFSAMPALLAFQNYRDKGFSQEIRFTSPRNGRFRWLLGAYHVEYTHVVDTLALADPGLFLGAPTGIVDFPVADTVDHNRLENYSAFAQAEYDILPELELAVALRFDNDRNQLRTDGAAVRSASFSEWQPKVSLRYKPGENMSVYTSYGEGFRSGGFNPSGATIGGPIFLPETAATYELGFRGNFLNRRLSFSVAAFHTTLDNAQLLVLDVLSGANVGLNVEETVIQGLEAEMSARIGDSLSVYAALGLTNGKVEEFTGVPAFTGNRLPRVPRETINLGFTHEMDLGSSFGTTLRVDYQHIGGFFWEVANLAHRRSVNYLNARFVLQHEDTGISLALWGRNLLGDRATSDYQPFSETGHPVGTDFFLPARGETLGIDLTIRF